MDPFSITTSVLRITGSFIGAAHTLWEIRNAWKLAPVTVSTLCSHLKLTAASLSRIQALLLSDTDVLLNKPDLVETFDTTLTNCLVLSTLLESYVQKIKKDTLEGTKATWKMKFKTIWNENEVKELLKQLTTQQDAVNLLVNLLQINSMFSIRKSVQKHEKLLREIVANTRHLRHAYGVEAPASILGTDEASESIFSQLIESKGNGKPGFESVILNTKAYTNAFTSALSPATTDDQSDDPYTVIDSQPLEIPPQSTANVTVVRKTVLGTIRGLIDAPGIIQTVQRTVARKRSLIDEPEIRQAVRNLGIINIAVGAIVDHSAQLDGELSFKKDERIYNVQRLTKDRYQGQTGQGEKSAPAMWGQFDRNKVIIGFELRRPIQGRTNFGCRLIKYIYHGEVWWTEQCDDCRCRGGFTRVNGIKLPEACEKDIDQLLEFFACPIPELIPFPPDKLHQELERKIEEDWPNNANGIRAHCSSFQDLQQLTSMLMRCHEREDFWTRPY